MRDLKAAFSLGAQNRESGSSAVRAGKAPADDLTVRLAQRDDLPLLLAIFADARARMRENGNPHQWAEGYPPMQLVAQDIAEKHCYVCERAGRAVGVFTFFIGPDPTYARIEGGAWRDDSPYGVLHRVAGLRGERGIGACCTNFCKAHCGHLRGDTHRLNTAMQRVLENAGFVRCGIIHTHDGTERLAYEWSRRVT